ncbi:MAG TPA: NADPH-dependent FMN reductase [Thermoanaerobaculia bacterium]|nr:NADPH-dependent FMN reductase [Thermoanaerobaculia bacterium]
MKVAGISGSLRRGSYNSLLLRLAAASAPESMAVEIASIREIPLYDGDVESESGIPPPVAALKDALAAADGLLIATPEYNHSIPGVVKNAIDWLSRPPRDIPRVFGGLPVAIMGATPGRGGTQLAQAAWLPVLRALGTRPWFGRIMVVSNAAQIFGEERITDDDTRARLERFISGFAEFVSGAGRRRD